MALTDISSHVRQFYSRFNNVLSVIGKGSREMCTLHLNKVYCLPSLPYGYETGFWRESVKPLQYFCQSLPISYFIDQRKLLFWRKLAMHNNNFLLSLSRLCKPGFMPLAACMVSVLFLLQLVKLSWPLGLSLQRLFESFVMFV